MANPAQSWDCQVAGELVEEDWRNIQDARERKKLQNRIAQRSYRKRTQRRIQALENMYKAVKTNELLRSAGQYATNVEPIFSLGEHKISKHYESYGLRQSDSDESSANGDLLLWREQPECGANTTYDVGGALTPFQDVFDMNDYLPSGVQDDAWWHHRECVAGNGVKETMGTEHPREIRLDDQNQHVLPRWRGGNHEQLTELSPSETVVAGVTVESKGGTKDSNSSGQSALHIAAERGNQEIMRILLQRNVDVMAQDSNGRTALHLAVTKGHGGLIAELLKQPGLAEVRAKDGQTALHLAVSAGSKDLVSKLTVSGDALEVKDALGKTALHLALLHGHDDIAKLLMMSGADINATISG
ncbi:hypothetical protein NUW58_g271 [Xylaria curta]|uniref:Uncharacterized protein n=1 Tax=Xylaria curta TaxID=42375 RepID=A0ACC1PQC7_9PEZI|nr:hypothetical protein NUW58_g271 [Xylaria curta]